MTDKQMAEKKKEFIIKLAEYRTLYDNSFHSDTEEEILYLIEVAGDTLWDFIEKLVEHCYTQGKIEGCKECLEEQDEHGSYGTSFEN